MAQQSLDYGCERPIEPKAWRRGAANAANGNAPDAVRDQMMRHDPKWATFNSAYINEKVQFHLQNAVLDEPTEIPSCLHRANPIFGVVTQARPDRYVVRPEVLALDLFKLVLMDTRGVRVTQVDAMHGI
ncbi:hypothetical protein QBC46DRAFT_454414 [Diplogelasinospora grovesii]|uniref:Uncharacterized protein n=1 Tax=Diplogelasinospora grovesii TaxID=303347 RepID=A0AAN6RY30_9PEZI|nr:hypothetical protein QBC46DRAFT_454414 [Diplogelasinospora grovesii]